MVSSSSFSFEIGKVKDETKADDPESIIESFGSFESNLKTEPVQEESCACTEDYEAETYGCCVWGGPLNNHASNILLGSGIFRNNNEIVPKSLSPTSAEAVSPSTAIETPLVESATAKYMRMSSIMSSSFSLLDTLPNEREETINEHSTRQISVSNSTIVSGTQHVSNSALISASVNSKQNQHYHQHDETEPFISSLSKSVEIMKQVPAATRDEDEKENAYSLEWLFSTTLLTTILHLSVFSILGTALRIFLGHLFGSDCHHRKASWFFSVVTSVNLCVTSNGESKYTGGSLFIDLPANMIGSFLMGFFQPSQDLGLLNNVPVAFLNTGHWFQSWTVIHLGLRTGFCGSLTTLASWNTQMVKMIDGDQNKEDQIQFFSAIFGYIVGLELALASLSLGQSVAIWMYRCMNPDLAREEDILMFAYSKPKQGKISAPIKVNKALPDYERRYLASLLPQEQRAWAQENINALQHLERWKISTDTFRTKDVYDEALLSLHEIERKVLVDEEDLTEDLLQLADKMGWDIQSLQNFAEKANAGTFNEHNSQEQKDHSSTCSNLKQIIWISTIFAAALLLVVVFGFLGWKDHHFPSGQKQEQDLVRTFYQSSWLAIMLAPFGTIVRWQLASFNGNFFNKRIPSLAWFPLGTFTANVLASVISIIAQALIDTSSSSVPILSTQILTAVKIGIAGSMSTVSTFVAEGNMLQKSFPHHAKAHYYMIGTLTCAAVFGLLIYSPLVGAITWGLD